MTTWRRFVAVSRATSPEVRLTLFSIPKAFTGDVATIQRNALRSWTSLGEGVEIVLLGDDDGTKEAAEAFGVAHIPGVARDERGIPRLDDAFNRARGVDPAADLCFVNADVILLDDLPAAVERVFAWRRPALVVGRTCDTDVGELADDWRPQVRAAVDRGRYRGLGAMDYFVFTRQLFAAVPPFVVGRAGFDNWLVWRARADGAVVVDVTSDVLAIHQAHGYAHVRGGKTEAYLGEAARTNIELAGGKRRLYTLADATHRLRGGRITRNPWAIARLGDLIRRVRWKLGLDRLP